MHPLYRHARQVTSVTRKIPYPSHASAHATARCAREKSSPLCALNRARPRTSSRRTVDTRDRRQRNTPAQRSPLASRKRHTQPRPHHTRAGTRTRTRRTRRSDPRPASLASRRTLRPLARLPPLPADRRPLRPPVVRNGRSNEPPQAHTLAQHLRQPCPRRTASLASPTRPSPTLRHRRYLARNRAWSDASRPHCLCRCHHTDRNRPAAPRSVAARHGPSHPSHGRSRGDRRRRDDLPLSPLSAQPRRHLAPLHRLDTCFRPRR